MVSHLFQGSVMRGGGGGYCHLNVVLTLTFYLYPLQM